MEKNSKIAKVLPFATTIFLLGVVFGASSKVTTISDKGAILMSALVFSGASQFAALNLWQLGAFSVILSTALLSSRFILMSASLSLEAQKLSLHQKVLLAFGIIDESYGLYISESYEGKNKDFSSFFLSSFVFYLCWLSGTLTGVLWGSKIPLAVQAYLEHVFPMVFLVLTIMTLDSLTSITTAVVTVILFLIGIKFFSPSWLVLIVTVLSSLIGLFLPQPKKRGEK